MESFIFVILFITIVVLFIETILSIGWNLYYFKTGITIYKATIKGHNIFEPIPSADRIKSLFPKSVGSGILMHNIGDNVHVFREKYFIFIRYYMPIMRGCLEFKPNTREIIVIGQLNWSVIFLTIMFTSIIVEASLRNPVFYIFLVIQFIILVWGYAMQAKRFSKVARVAMNEWSGIK